LLEASEEILDQVATVVGGTIEGVGMILGTEPGDGLACAATTEIDAVAAPGVPLVARSLAGANARQSASGPMDRPLVHERFEHGRFVLPPRSEQDAQRLAGPIGPEVHPGQETALAPPQHLGFWVTPLHQQVAGARG
jgi:hypothetical protein